LDLDGCSQFGDRACAALAASQQKLRTGDFKDTDVGPEGLKSLASIPTFSNLKLGFQVKPENLATTKTKFNSIQDFSPILNCHRMSYFGVKSLLPVLVAKDRLKKPFEQRDTGFQCDSPQRREIRSAQVAEADLEEMVKALNLMFKQQIENRALSII